MIDLASLPDATGHFGQYGGMFVPETLMTNFIELTAEGFTDLRRGFIEGSVPMKETWWGYDTLQVDDPDGNELFFPRPD